MATKIFRNLIIPQFSLRGDLYISLPTYLSDKKAIIDMQNKNNQYLK